MQKINIERSQRFIPTLTTNSKLISAATSKAHDMIDRSYFSHVNPDGQYVWPTIEAAGYKPYLTLGENLAMDFTSAGAVVAAWMNSPTHRANIVNDKFEDQGLASVSGLYEPQHETAMVVSLFGTLYKSKTPTTTTQPSSTPTSPPKQTPKPVAITPKPASAPSPTPAPTPVETKVEISKDIKITTSLVSDHLVVSIDTIVAGSPTLVTAQLKGQTINMLLGSSSGEFKGDFTFDPNEDLKNQNVTIEARDSKGEKTSLLAPFSFEPEVSGGQALNQIPVSQDAYILKILRIIFGIFALVYMAFLIVDAVIIRRAKIKRVGIHTDNHILVFLLISLINIFISWN